jgi:serine/threonine protein kinase
MEPHRLALNTGFRLENFQIERILGKGGFGITYVALDMHLGKRVAIKELLPDSIATRVEGSTVVPQTASMQESWEWARARFLEEAQILAGFSHPAIVGVHRLIEANGTVYMVMDFIDGESYESRLRRIGREPSQEALLEVISPILDGLREVHSKNLLHRDIKPENILLSSTGQPMLIDFGSARTSIGATMSMTSIVTHGYSPIEQYQTKGKMGPWTDIYAIGAVMCRAITGEKPPVAADRIVQDDFEWVSNRKPAGYDETFLNAVDWALRVRVEDRPENISAFSQHIRLAPTPSTPPPLPTPPPVKVEPAPVVSTPTPKKEKNNNLKGFLILAIAISVPVFYFSGAFSKNESKATFDAANRSEYEDLRKNAEKELAELNIRIAEREKALQQPTATPTPQQPDAATYEKITALVAESDKAFRIGEYDIGLEKIRQADHLLPNDAGILLRIARLHEKRNETEDAASIYNTVLALPDLGQELRTQTRRKLGMLENAKAQAPAARVRCPTRDHPRYSGYQADRWTERKEKPPHFDKIPPRPNDRFPANASSCLLLRQGSGRKHQTHRVRNHH